MKKIMLLLVCLIGMQSLHAQDHSKVFSRIAEHNPKVRAAYQQYLISLESIHQVGPLDPEITAGYFITPMMMPDGEQRAMLSLMQMFPWFGSLQTDRNMRSKEAERMYWLFVQRINEVFFEMKGMMIDYSLLSRESKLYDSLIHVSYEEERLLRANLASGEGGLESIIRLHQERDEYENRLLELSHSLGSIRERLRLLANEAGGVELQDLGYNSSEMLVWEGSGPEQHPLWQSYLSREESLDYKVELAKKMGKPMMGLGMAYTLVSPLSGMPEPGNPRNLVQPMLSVSLPIYQKKYRATVDRAMLEKQELEEQKAATINQWEMELSTLRASWQSSTDREALLMRKWDRIKDLQDLAMASQSSGEEALLSLLKLKKEVFRLQFDLEREKHQRAHLTNQLRFIKGVNIDNSDLEAFTSKSQQKN